eukprot:TRINITY_DN5_c0_g1_i1.p1 TRINITY_DN5_c0_g1~~TRINITY_DN5_c0_g1_i1.p1  ORF type:complete len:203 (-),score=37.00 TRINITY_DN5_c0_g1_i1:101-709(-)
MVEPVKLNSVFVGVEEKKNILNLICFAHREGGSKLVFHSREEYFYCGDNLVEMKLKDTEKDDEFFVPRALSYKDADIVYITYDVNDRDSFDDVELKWIRETRHYSKNPIVVLIGTSIENRNSVESVSYEEGKEMSQKIKADLFFECSTREETIVVDGNKNETVDDFIILMKEPSLIYINKNKVNKKKNKNKFLSKLKSKFIN